MSEISSTPDGVPEVSTSTAAPEPPPPVDPEPDPALLSATELPLDPIVDPSGGVDTDPDAGALLQGSSDAVAPVPPAADSAAKEPDPSVKITETEYQALSRREQWNRQRARALIAIRGAVKQYNSSYPGTGMESTQETLSGDGADVKALTEALFTLRDFVSDVPEQYERTLELSAEIGRNVLITHKGIGYQLGELDLARLTGNKDKLPITEILDEGEYEYKDTLELDTVLVSQSVKERKAAIQKRIEVLERSKTDASMEKAQLKLLTLAELADTQAGGVVAVRALELMGDRSLTELLQNHSESIVEASRRALDAHLSEAGLNLTERQAMWDLARNGKWEELVKYKQLEDSGLDKWIFGNNSDQAMEILLKSDEFNKYGKAGIFAILIILASSAGELKNVLAPSAR